MISNLTERDKRILDLLVEFGSNKAIAAVLNLSEVTIKNTITEIYQKVDVKGDRVLLAVWWDRQTRKTA